jgi:hypothetical protein
MLPRSAFICIQCLLSCKTTPLFYNVSEQEGSYKSFYNIWHGVPGIKEDWKARKYMEGINEFTNMVLSDREKELRGKLRACEI